MKTKKARIIKDYKNCKNSFLVSRSNNVYNSMNGNALFAAPPVLMADLKSVIDQLTAGMVIAQHRDRLKSAQKNLVVAQLVIMLDKLADYVTAIADGDEATLLAAGFAVNSAATSTPSFGPVKNFTVDLGPGSGNITVSVKKIEGATGYSLQYGIDNGANTVWLYTTKARRRYVVKDLQPGKTYIFKMLVAGTNDRETASETITKIVA